MEKLIVLSGDQAYARSKTSSTKDTALTPNLLNKGAVGFYGIVGTDSSTSGNNGKNCLISDGNTPAAGVIDVDTFIAGGGFMFNIAEGNTENSLGTGYFNYKNLQRVWKQTYTAPKKQVSFIGYNGSTGSSLNLPTIALNDIAVVLGIPNVATTTDQIREQENYDSGKLVASESAYSICAKVAYYMNHPLAGDETKTNTVFVVGNGTVADFTGTATALYFVNGSKTVSFMIQDATDGWVASTGSVTAGDVINVPTSNIQSFSCLINAAGSGAGRNVINIDGTIYNCADAGTAAQNAAAMAVLINADTIATAVVSGTSTLTVTMRNSTYCSRPVCMYTADDSAWTILTTTIVSGETQAGIYKAAASVSGAASFELDYAYEGHTGYFVGGTTANTNAGIMTSITEYGLKLTVDTVGVVYSYAVQEVFESATLTYSVGASKGLGVGTDIVQFEKDTRVKRGSFDTVDRRMPIVNAFADGDTAYDVYTIDYKGTTTDSGFTNDKSILSSVYIAIPAIPPVGGYTGQAIFDTTLGALAVAAGAITNLS